MKTISATGISSSPGRDDGHARGTDAGAVNRGFTLIELLVVLVLIGIITSFAVLSIRTDPWDREMRRELQRLTALVSAGREHAVLRAQELAIRFEKTQYSFLTPVEEDWQPVTGDPLFRTRSLPDGLAVEVILEDEDEGNDAEAGLETAHEGKPLVLLLSSGEVTPFKAIIKAEETGARVERSWDAFGEVEKDSDDRH